MKRIQTRRIRQQRGLILLLAIIALLFIGGAAYFLSADRSGSSVKLDRDVITTKALAVAKDALLAYTISRDDYSSFSRPGEFPCPTIVPPSDLTYGVANNSCTTIPRIGRLPWLTLGIPELLDGYGEPLWYSLSGNFKPSGTVAINSNSVGQLIVYGADGASVQESEAVVVIFSAGSQIAGQNRTSAMSLCSTTSSIIAANVCAANYLEAFAGKNNATNSGPYTFGNGTSTFNDRGAVITTADFIPQIENRIAINLKKTVDAYYQLNGFYPYAAYYSDIKQPLSNAPASRSDQANCAQGVFSGRLPEYINDMLKKPLLPNIPCSGYLQEWPGTASSNSMPAWFFINNWHTTIFYAVAKQYVQGITRGANPCSIAGNCLTVDGDSAVQAVFILPGVRLPTQIRPTSTPAPNVSSGLDIKNYFEDPENQQGWATFDNAVYKSTASTAPSRDLVIAIKN
jgi:hypothetical protein